MTTWTVYTSFTGCLPEGAEPPPIFESYEDARSYWTDEAAAEIDGLTEWAEYDDDKGENAREDARTLEEAREAEEMRSPHGPRSLYLPRGADLILEEMEQEWTHH
jgi:hypothetical protein